MDTYKITVVIPVFNGENFIEECIESIQSQKDVRVKILVSENHCTDNTARIVRRYTSGDSLTVIRPEKKLSMLENFNFALEHIETEYYLLLCHDDYLGNENALKMAFDIMTENKDITAVYCDLDYVNESRKLILRRSFNRSGHLQADLLGRQTIRTARNMFGIPLLIRRSALADHRYNTQLTYIADADLSWAISKNGPVYHIPQALIANRYYGSNSTWNLLKVAERQFVTMAAGYGMSLTGMDLLRLRLTNWFVAQQKRLFGIYVRCHRKLT